MFDLPSMLGEYLLPLLLLVPLAVVVVLVVTRQQKEEEPWQQRPVPPAAPRAAPVAFSPTAREPAAVPVPSAPQGLFETTEPAALERAEPATPFVAAGQPLAEPPRAPVSSTPGSQVALAGPLPLLVVDDSAVVRAKLAKLLGGAGYAVTLARHGHEAIEQLNQHWFALMITDLEMPEMDGFELIAQVSNDLRTENLPIVAITGHEALQAKVQDARGLFGIFKKPWNDRELLARVEALSRLRPRSA